MAKHSMCRICLAVDVRMHSIVNIHLQQMYENLSMTLFETQDNRPLQACYMCYAKLRNCYQLRMTCIQSEKLLTEMLRNNMLNSPNTLENSISKRLKIVHPVIQMSVEDTVQQNAAKERHEVSCDVKVEPEDTKVIKEEPPDVTDTQKKAQPSDVEDDVSLRTIKKELSLNTSASDPATCNPTPGKENVGEISCNNRNDKKLSSRKTNIKVLNYEILFKCQEIEHNDFTVKNKQFICDICQKCFIRKNDLSRHILIHTGEKPYQCKLCKKRFVQKISLKIHTRVHSGEKPYECDTCTKTFNNGSDLNKHYRTHTGAKPYQCHICKKSFRQKGELRKHIRTHTGEKPYQCNLCTKGFNYKHILDTHIRTHTGEKPFQCDICLKSFRQKGDLGKHIRIHTGEKPFACKICNKCFNIKSNLNTHLRLHAR